MSSGQMRDPSSVRIGLLVESLSDRFWQEIVIAVDAAARRRGVRLFVFIGGTLDAPEIAARQANRCYQLPSPASVDGLILAPLGYCAGPERLAQYFLRYRPLPMSALTLVFDKVPSVCTDNVQSMQQAVSHLIETHGARRVAFLRGPRLNAEAELRYRGYQQALEQHGIALDPALVLQGDFSEHSGARSMRELRFEGKPPFEALVAANDSMALGALAELASRGVRVPDHVLVVGFDDVPEGRWSKPSLSTLRQPLPSLADTALSHVLLQLAGGTPSPLTLTAGELVLRESCGCRAIFDALVPPPGSAPPPPSLRPAPPGDGGELSPVQLEQRLREIKPSGNEQLPRDWRGQLATAFTLEMRGVTGRGQQLFSELLTSAASSGRELGDWQRVVSALRAALPPVQQAQGDGLLYRYRVLVADAAERQQAARRIYSEAMLRETIAAGSDVLGSFSERRMFDALAAHLPRIGMRGCYVALYEPSPLWPPHQARMIFAYRDGQRVELPEQGLLFATRELAPASILPAAPGTLTVSPLFFGDNPLGMLLFEFGPPQGQIYEWLREQISVALEGARLIRRVDREVAERERAERQRLQHELSLAARIQTSVLPDRLQVEGLEIAATMVPATEVGGDCYDVLPFAGGAWLSIGDVAGHGLGPGVVMMMLQSSVAAVLRADPDAAPSAALEIVNAVLFENLKQRLQQDEHATLMLLRYEASGRLCFAGAHEEPIVYRARTGVCEVLPAPGLWVGIKPDVRGQMPETEERLEPGDVLLLYTDGAVEARNARKQQYGVQRLARQLEAVHAKPLAEIRDHLLRDVQSWMDTQRDDISLLVARQQGR
jgi:DNA-binding LacI/PurR family transcriptional regulator/serine phosphatase RsbU (regulator of sigma subunit)